MKYILLSLLSFALLTSCSNSQQNADSSWTSIQYSYSSGPLPPPYHYSYDITVNSDCTASLNYMLGYEESQPLNYTFSITKDKMKMLSEKISASQISTGKIESVPENRHPIGGSLEKAKLVVTKADPNLDQPPKAFESPYFPVEKYKKNLEELYTFIKSLVPENVWSEVNAKKSDFESKHKN